MIIGIDLGGTFIKVGLVEKGQILQYTAIDNRYSPSDFRLIENTISTLLDKAQCSVRDCDGVGIAMPGIVDTLEKKSAMCTAKTIIPCIMILTRGRIILIIYRLLLKTMQERR